MKLIIGQEGNAPFEMVRQDLQGEVGPGRYIRSNVILGLLERQAIQGFGSVCKELIQHLVDALFSRRNLHVGIVPDVSVETHGVADRFGLNDQLQPVGKYTHGRMNGGRRNGEFRQDPGRPVGQLDMSRLRQIEGLLAPEPFGHRRGSARRLGRKDGRYGPLRDEAAPGHRIDLGDGYPGNGIEIVLGRVPAFDRQGIGPGHGQALHRIFLKLRIGHFATLGNLHQFIRKAVLEFPGQHLLQVGDDFTGVAAFGKGAGQIPQPDRRQGVEAESGLERLALDHQIGERSPAVVQYVGQDLSGGVVRAVVSRHAKSDHGQPVRQVRLHADGLGLDGRQMDPGPPGKRLGGNRAEVALHPGQRFCG